ncbi:MAG: phytoene/squalene synthase family protein [Candidatus Woesearchaeota archaeon]
MEEKKIKMNKNKEIIKRESLNFYLSSIIFPKKIRNEVYDLYAFVRVMDNFIDENPVNYKKYYDYKREFLKNDSSNDKIIQNFKELSKKFEKEWIDAFFYSLERDIKNYKYKTMKDLEKYLYGISEVIGLMMARILNLKKESYYYARMLGKSLQLANIIRDIKEDLEKNRNYIPLEVMKKFNVKSLNKEEKNIAKLILYLIDIYESWQNEAEKGYKFLSKRMRIAVKTSADNYKWTINKIKRNPLIVFEKQIKPSKRIIIFNIIKNILFA